MRAFSMNYLLAIFLFVSGVTLSMHSCGEAKKLSEQVSPQQINGKSFADLKSPIVFSLTLPNSNGKSIEKTGSYLVPWDLENETAYSKTFFEANSNSITARAVLSPSTGEYFVCSNNIGILDPKTGAVSTIVLDVPTYDLQKSATANGYLILEDNRAHPEGMKLAIFDSNKRGITTHVLIPGATTSNRDYVTDSANLFWFSAMYRGSATLFRLDPVSGKFDAIYSAPKGESILCMRELAGQILVSQYPLGNLSDSSRTKPNKIVAIDAKTKKINKSITDRKYPTSFISNSFVYRQQPYFFFSHNQGSVFRHNLQTLDLDKGAFVDTGKSIDFWYTGQAYVRGKDLFLFNELKRDAIYGIRYDIDRGEVTQKYDVGFAP